MTARQTGGGAERVASPARGSLGRRPGERDAETGSKAACGRLPLPRDVGDGCAGPVENGGWRRFGRAAVRHLDETGLTPARAVKRLRVAAAGQMLSEPRHPVKRIAQRCGFGSEESLRRTFLRLLATTPQAYPGWFGG